MHDSCPWKYCKIQYLKPKAHHIVAWVLPWTLWPSLTQRHVTVGSSCVCCSEWSWVEWNGRSNPQERKGKTSSQALYQHPVLIIAHDTEPQKYDWRGTIHFYSWMRGEKKLGGEWKVERWQPMFSKGTTGSHLGDSVPGSWGYIDSQAGVSAAYSLLQRHISGLELG